MNRQLVLIVHNVRSCHNVGALLRTADGLGVHTIYLTGYTPYPTGPTDDRLPHLRQKIDSRIHKTALGAEKSVHWQQEANINTVFKALRRQGFQICALEQATSATPLMTYRPTKPIALVVGREVEGIEPAVLDEVDTILEIPMFGQKESFNVVQAAAMALFYLRFM